MKRNLRTLPWSGAVALILVSLTPSIFAQSETAETPEAPVAGSDAAGSDAASSVDGDSEAPQAETQEGSAETEEAAEESAAPEVDPYAEAKERVGRAEQLFNDGNYDAALTEFEQAYEQMLGHPARNYVLFNVGKCQEKLYRYDDAISSYRTYLKNSGDGAEDKATVEAKIELLEGLLGTLTVSVTATEGAAPSSYEVWVDGRLINPENNETFMIPGGNHQVEVRAEGFEVQNQEVQIPARAKKTLAFSLKPLAAEYKGLPKTYFWTATTLAGVAAAGGGAFGIMAVTKRSDIDQKEPELITQEDQDAVKGRALTADLFFAGAGVFATTAVILAFMTDWSNDSEASPIQVKEVGFAPTRRGGFIGVRGAF